MTYLDNTNSTIGDQSVQSALFQDEHGTSFFVANVHFKDNTGTQRVCPSYKFIENVHGGAPPIHSKTTSNNNCFVISSNYNQFQKSGHVSVPQTTKENQAEENNQKRLF